jgi:hypothetical protein
MLKFPKTHVFQKITQQKIQENVTKKCKQESRSEGINNEDDAIVETEAMDDLLDVLEGECETDEVY